MRRQRVMGLRQSDVAILEHLYNGGSPIIDSPNDIAVNIQYAPATVRERVTVLREVGLIQYFDSSVGQYEIDDLGRKYLLGELTDSEIDRLEARLQK